MFFDDKKSEKSIKNRYASCFFMKKTLFKPNCNKLNKKTFCPKFSLFREK